MDVKILSTASAQAFVPGYFRLAQDSHFWIRGRLASALKQIRSQGIDLNRQMRGFEIGCGSGIVRSQLEARSAWTIDGSDLDLAALKNNPPCRGEVYLYNVFDRHPSLRHFYDFIILFDVIEHIDQVGPFMEACLFHLKPGGYVFINVPAMSSLFSSYDSVQGHYRRYDKRFFLQTLENAGLRTLRANYWGMCFIPLVFLRKMLFKAGDKEEIYRKGFKPPGTFANFILSGAIYAEVGLMPEAPLGTSIMAIAQKPSEEVRS